MDFEKKLNTLSSNLGIQLSYIDVDTGNEYFSDTKSKQKICTALGYPAETEKEIEYSLKKLQEHSFSYFIPYTKVLPENIQFSTETVIDASRPLTTVLSWVLTREDGTTEAGETTLEQLEVIDELTVKGVLYKKYRIYCPIQAGIGYHIMVFLLDGEKPKTNNTMQLIITPYQCYTPDCFETKGVWGYPLQLYALRSDKNFGIGDFTDLKDFCAVALKTGASVVGINPLNALFPNSPEEASPYSASSRIFLNPMYIDTNAVPESDFSEYQTFIHTPKIANTIEKLRESSVIDYYKVTTLKLQCLHILFKGFKAFHLNAANEPQTPRGEAFIEFCTQQGKNLTLFATFHTLREHFMTLHKSALWWEWDKRYLDPDSPTVQRFIHNHADAILEKKYQQFIAFEQYNQVGKTYYDSGFCIGLYADLPVSVNLNSAEVWANQSVFLPRLSVGAPPDPFNTQGQCWAVAAFNPETLWKNGYKLYRDLLRNTMKNVGALRLDHAFSLMRLFICVENQTGAYLNYNFDEFAGILALESVRNQCLIVTEDLGMAPPSFYDKMRPFQTLSFRLFRFQKQGDRFLFPNEYERQAVVSVGTHDMPTFSAFWKNIDIELLQKLKFITPKTATDEREKRAVEKKQLAELFTTQNLPMPPLSELVTDLTDSSTVPTWFIRNTYHFLGLSNSLLLLVRLEDILQQDEQVNVPGTFLEYKNWRYKLPQTITQLENNASLLEITETLRTLRKNR